MAINGYGGTALLTTPWSNACREFDLTIEFAGLPGNTEDDCLALEMTDAGHYTRWRITPCHLRIERIDGESTVMLKEIPYSVFDDSVQPYRLQQHPHGGSACYLPAPTAHTLDAVLDALLPVADVRFEHAPPGERQWHALVYSQSEGLRQRYYFANSSDDVIDCPIILRGRLLPECWDPHTGKVEQVAYAHDMVQSSEVTRLQLHLEAVGSVFVVG